MCAFWPLTFIVYFFLYFLTSVVILCFSSYFLIHSLFFLFPLSNFHAFVTSFISFTFMSSNLLLHLIQLLLYHLAASVFVCFFGLFFLSFLCYRHYPRLSLCVFCLYHHVSISFLMLPITILFLLMFLIVYLITYFFLCYLLFVSPWFCSFLCLLNCWHHYVFIISDLCYLLPSCFSFPFVCCLHRYYLRFSLFKSFCVFLWFVYCFFHQC